MVTIVIRSILIYCIVLLVFRLMGKRQIGQMQPFELVLTLIIADLATIPMAEISIPVLHGIVPLLTLVVLHFVLTILTRVSVHLSSFLSGKPVILINPNGIDYKAMKKLNMTIDDIFAALREKGYFSVGQIQYAIVETNGKISVLPKAEYAPATSQDVNSKPEESFVPITLVSEGKVLKENVALALLDEKKVEKMVKDFSGAKVKDVLVLTIEQSGKGYIQLKKDKGKMFETAPLKQVEGA